MSHIFWDYLGFHKLTLIFHRRSLKKRSMQRNHTSESADDHGAQRSDCGPPQQVNPCFSFEEIIDSSKFIDSSRNAVDINDSSNTDTKGMPNEDTHNSLNEDINDILNTDTDVSNKDINDSPDEATNDTPNKNTIAIWGHTSQLYSRLHDLHSALILYNEFDDICPGKSSPLTLTAHHITPASTTPSK
jgi:hypothetical protein